MSRRWKVRYYSFMIFWACFWFVWSVAWGVYAAAVSDWGSLSIDVVCAAADALCAPVWLRMLRKLRTPDYRLIAQLERELRIR